MHQTGGVRGVESDSRPIADTNGMNAIPVTSRRRDLLAGKASETIGSSGTSARALDGLRNRQESGRSAPYSSRGCCSVAATAFNCQHASPIHRWDPYLIMLLGQGPGSTRSGASGMRSTPGTLTAQTSQSNVRTFRSRDNAQRSRATHRCRNADSS